MATLKLGEIEYRVGELTGAHLEDHYDAVLLVTEMAGAPSRAQFSALLTLAHQAVLAGGAVVSREDMVAKVRWSDAGALATAVVTALGFAPASASTGEADRPEGSQG